MFNRIKDTSHMFDKKGKPRQFTELPDGTVPLLSDEEFREEMASRDNDIPDKWPKEHKLPKKLNGAGSLEDRKSSPLPPPPSPKWLH